LDPERADLLEPIAGKIAAEAGTRDFLIIESHEGKKSWAGMKAWSDILDICTTNIYDILQNDPGILPEDNATVIFTSGTCVYRVALVLVLMPHCSFDHRTGLPKGVLSTQRMFLTNILNVRHFLQYCGSFLKIFPRFS
jgi:hypothetical protein